jgi:HEAT repeat protein
MSMYVRILLPALPLVLLLIGCGSGEKEYGGFPVSAWIAALQSPDLGQRGQAAAVLAGNAPQDPSIVPGLIKAVRAGNFGAAEVLAKIGSGVGPHMDEVIKALGDVVKSKLGNSPRLAAARALPQFGAPAAAAAPALLEMLKDDDAVLRRQAAESIAMIPSISKETAGKQLEDAARDPVVDVSHAAQKALQVIDPERAKKLRGG